MNDLSKSYPNESIQRKNETKPKIPYRKDINGLRAWAVLAVLLYHFKIPGLEAGFVGVDVFFVISGFLMTAIITKGLDANTFSISKFYLDRARRILPALLTVIIVLLVVGWFFLPDQDYKLLATQSIYSTLSISNFYFWREADYFGTGAHEKWLLHTWSLAVEAHFYILFPIFLSILWKIKPHKKTIYIGLLSLTALSLLLSIAVSKWQPQAAFYLLPTRAWELCFGGLVFLAGRDFPSLHSFKKPFLWAGFCFLIASIVILTNKFPWPSGWALLPVLGAALILLSNTSTSRLTSNYFAQWVGDRSYSMYLWHWPIMVSLYFLNIIDSTVWKVAGIALSFLFAHLSYHFVERPTHHYLVKKKPTIQARSIGIACSLLIACLGIIIVSDHGNRIPKKINLVAAEANNRNSKAYECRYRLYNNSIPGCIFGEQKTNLILAGDSHSEAIASALEASAIQNQRGFIYYGGAHGCPTLNNADQAKDKCKNYNELINDKIADIPTDIPLLIINTSWIKLFQNDEYSKSLVETICNYTKNGRTVYINRPIPGMKVNVPNTLSRAMIFDKKVDPIRISKEDYFQANKKVWDAQDEAVKQCGAKILDPLPYLCDDQYCYGEKDNFPLYFDTDHLSEHGNKYLVPMFNEVFQSL